MRISGKYEIVLLDGEDLERRSAIATAARAADLDELVDALADHENAPRRNDAMEALTRGGTRSVPTLIRALKHSDSDVVLFATNVLGRTRDASAVPHLLALLEHHEPNVVSAAIESLGQLRAVDAVEPLIGMLEKAPWLALTAIHALGQIGDDRAIETLVLHTRDELFADFVSDALGRIGTPVALEHLANLALEVDGSSSPAIVWRAIARALEQIPNERAVADLEPWKRLRTTDARAAHEFLEQALDSDTAQKAMAIEVLRVLRIERLYPKLLGLAADAGVRDRVEFTALSIGAEIEPALRGALRSPEPEVRVFACNAAGLLDLQGLAHPVEELLRDPDEAVAAAAVDALGRMGRHASVPRLIELAHKRSPTVSEAAIRALRAFDAALVTDALLGAAPADPVRRLTALRILAANPHPKQLAFVRECLRDEDPRVRGAAAEAIAAEASLAVRDLVPLLVDPSVEVRRHVIALLGGSRTPEVRHALLAQVGRDPETRDGAVRALGRVGDVAVARELLALFSGATPAVKVAIVETLAELSATLAKPLFVRLLADDEPEVRRAAVLALARSGTASAFRHAVVAARDPAWQVRAALAETLNGTDSAVLQVFERLSVDPNDHVAAVACRRLSELTEGQPDDTLQ